MVVVLFIKSQLVSCRYLITFRFRSNYPIFLDNAWFPSYFPYKIVTNRSNKMSSLKQEREVWSSTRVIFQPRLEIKSFSVTIRRLIQLRNHLSKLPVFIYLMLRVLPMAVSFIQSRSIQQIIPNFCRRLSILKHSGFRFCACGS
jgi:hypothetical protein